MQHRNEKSRSSAGTDRPARPKNLVVCNSLGYLDSSPEHRINQDILLWRKGYEAGLRDGLAQGPTHPAVQRSVANFFGGWDGAENALKRSANRFRQEQQRERDVA